jgi:outer membrane murein-binding lipoprotein Lpp
MNKSCAIKMLATICLSFLLFSCSNKDKEIDQLNQRITLLEQKIDALSSGRNGNSIRLNSMTIPGTDSYNAPLQSGRCQAITKKGTQCRRKAKSNSYCWQHGG